MADQHTKAEKRERPNKDEIKGLPAHAQYQFRQGTWYVYFPYCFREDGKRKQERDYIGTLSPDGKEFLPNLYYVQNRTSIIARSSAGKAPSCASAHSKSSMRTRSRRSLRASHQTRNSISISSFQLVLPS